MTMKKAITRTTASAQAKQSQASEARIIQALIHNIDGAFDQLVAAYQHELYAYAFRELKDHDNAEECVQDTFVRAYRDLLRKPLAERAVHHLRAWLYRILKNIIKDVQRTSKKRSALSLSPDQQSEREWLEQMLASGDLEREWMRSETTKQLAALIGQLPLIQQRILCLRYVYQLGYKDIGLHLDIPTATARNYAFRGIGTLQRLIAAQQQQEGALSAADQGYWEHNDGTPLSALDSWLFGEDILLEQYETLKECTPQELQRVFPEDVAFMQQFGYEDDVPLPQPHSKRKARADQNKNKR
jgi:RNA polymerase sigma-70 factor (ECF subfamily)